jgi:hypothetical protein
VAPVSDLLEGETDRAQLLLVGALSLAIALVAVALVLNSAIYTHNLASRQNTASDHAVTFARDARTSAGDTLDFVNRAEGRNGYGAVGNAYSNGVRSVGATLDERASVDVAATRVGHVANSRVRGVRVVDQDGGDFAPRSVDPAGSTDWTVARAVRVRSFEMTATGSLASPGLTDVEGFLDDLTGGSEVFTVEFDGDAERYRVAVYDDGGPTLTVHREGSSVYRTCSAPGADATIDFTAARFGGQACNALTFVDDLSDTYTVRYYNSDLVSGSYELYADLPIDDETGEVGLFTDLVDAANDGDDGYRCGATTYHPPGSSDYPRVVPALYATSLDVQYESPDVEFVGTQRVAPGEVGPPPVSPRITSVTVEEAGDGDDADFDVAVDVTDPNGDLQTVTVDLEAPDGDDTRSRSVSGDADSVSLTVQDAVDDTDDDGAEVTITVTVTDGDGNSRSVEQVHTVDDDETGCPP